MSIEIDGLCDSWSVLTSRPKSSNCPPTVILPQAAPTAVVMQGPIRYEDAFTEETLRLYRTTFPGATLILSTWDTEDPETLHRIEQSGVVVVTDSLPEVAGPDHVNYQIRSTRNGLEQAQRMGATFALKTRTDYRLCGANIANYLLGLWQAFPLAERISQRGRIVILDLVTRLYVPHHASDILMYGHIDDLLAYWSAPPNHLQKPRRRLRLIGDLLAEYIPEVYLCESHLHRIGRPCERTLRNWWQVLGELFLVVDRSSLGFFWPKYNYDTNHYQNCDDDLRNMALCTFKDWINMAVLKKECPFEIDALVNQRCQERL